MSVFSHRPGGFKAGVVLLFFSTLLFLAAFFTPFWATSIQYVVSDMPYSSTSYTVTYLEGLWMVCATSVSYTECGTYGVSGYPGWFHAVRALTCVCGVGLLVACIYTLGTNCCRAVAGPRSRFLEIFSAGAGLLGFVGCMVYVGLRNKDVTFDGDISSKFMAVFFFIKDWTFGWAFYLAAISSGLSLIAAILIAIFNQPVEVETSNLGGITISTMPNGGSPYGPPQPYSVYPAPGYPSDKV